jgi:DnaK suppressor protein
MNKAKIKDVLEIEKIELSDLISHTENEENIEVDGWKVVNEIGDESFESQEKLCKQEKLDLLNGFLRKVNQALADLENDRYGICNLCENEIAEDRLIAHPHAQYCISCQEKVDKEQE